MRIVETNNFGGDYSSEKFLLWSMSKEKAQKICDVLNDPNPYANLFYRVVENNYKLQSGSVP